LKFIWNLDFVAWNFVVSWDLVLQRIRLLMQNKKISTNLILLFFVLLLQQNGFTQSPYVPLNHWAYDFLERMETKHAVRSVLNHTKPLSRKEFADYLKRIKKSIDDGFVLNNVELEQFDFLELEFREELQNTLSDDSNYRSRIQKLKEHKTIKKYFPSFLYKNNRNFVSWQDQQIKIFFDPVCRYKMSYSKVDSKNQTEKAFHFTNGFQVWGYLTKYLGFFVNVRDNKEWGDKKYQLGNYTLPGLGFVRATSPDFIYHDETEAYIKFGIKNFHLIYGKFKNYWGNGKTGSLILSDNATSYDQIKFEYAHRKFKFTSIYAFLIDYRYHILDRLQQKKYMAGHRLEIAPWHWLTLGISETVIFKGRSFEPAYLNPVMFFRSAEHYLGSPDNMMMGFDLKYTGIRNIKLYGELLIDDIMTGKLGSGWYGNKYALLGGIFFAEPFNFNNFDVRIEYVRIRPYVYTHENSVQYTHYNSSLGHWIGPNSDLLTVLMKYQLTMRFSVAGSYCYLRHGANSNEVNYGGDIDRYFGLFDDISAAFLEGIKESKQHIGVNVSYEIMRNLFFKFNLYKEFSEKNNYKKNSISCLGSWGINY